MAIQFPHDVLVLFHDLAHLAVDHGPLWLVGGALRDALQGRPSDDYDFASPYDPTPLAKAFARRCAGSWFMMDKERRQSRVVLKTPGTPLTFDFAPLRAADLENDLRLRDFTLNALALEISRTTAADFELIDPLEGRADLEQCILRLCDPVAFDDDPLRMLRAIRMHAVQGFDLENATRRMLCEKAALIVKTAPERRTAELGKILSAPGCCNALELLCRTGLGGQAFGALNLSAEALDLLRTFERDAARLCKEEPLAQALYAEDVGDGLSRLSLMKLSLLLTEELSQGLKLSRKNLTTLQALNRQGRAADTAPPPSGRTHRAQALWVESFQPAAVEAILFKMAAEASAPAGARLREALENFLRMAHNGRIPDLLNGTWICRHLGIPSGPRLGTMLSALRAAELAGEVKNREDAENLMKSLAQKFIDN